MDEQTDKDGQKDSGSESNLKRVRLEVGQLPIPLKKTGQAVDRLLSAPINALAEWAEKKFQSNADTHVEAVTKSRTKRKKKAKLDPQPTLEELSAMSKWVSNAGRVEPSDRTLSAAWQAVLDRILDDGNDDDDLLDALSRIPKSTMREFFERFGRRRPTRAPRNLHGINYLLYSSMAALWQDPSVINPIREAGLIRPVINFRFVGVFVSPFVIWAMAAWGMDDYMFQQLLGSAQVRIIALSFAALIVILLMLTQVYKPTWRGRDLLERYNIYRGEQNE